MIRLFDFIIEQMNIGFGTGGGIIIFLIAMNYTSG